MDTSLDDLKAWIGRSETVQRPVDCDAGRWR